MSGKHFLRVAVVSLVVILSLALGVFLGGLPPMVGAQEPGGEVGILEYAGTSFTYQGQLKKEGNSVTDTCDFRFWLYDAVSGGSPKAGPVNKNSVSVTDGFFTAKIDFGADAFQGDARWLGIEVKCSGDGSYTSLLGRQELTPAPYAQTIYRRIVVVSPVGTDTENGTALLNALAAITDASSSTPYLLKIEPGTYDLGTKQLTMKDSVDIEGSGENVTTIRTAVSGDSPDESAAAIVGNTAELRFVRVENNATGGTHSITIYNNSGTSFKHVTIYSQGSAIYNYGVYNFSTSSDMMDMDINVLGAGTYNYSVYNQNTSKPVMTNVYAYASGATDDNCGVFNVSGSNPTMTNVTAEGFGGAYSYGLHNTGSASSVTIQNSVLKGSGALTNDYGIYNDGGSVKVHNSQIMSDGSTIVHSSVGTSQTYVGASMLDGGAVVVPAGTIICYACYDENFTNGGSVSTCP